MTIDDTFKEIVVKSICGSLAPVIDSMADRLIEKFNNHECSLSVNVAAVLEFEKDTMEEMYREAIFQESLL